MTGYNGNRDDCIYGPRFECIPKCILRQSCNLYNIKGVDTPKDLKTITWERVNMHGTGINNFLRDE